MAIEWPTVNEVLAAQLATLLPYGVIAESERNIYCRTTDFLIEWGIHSHLFYVTDNQMEETRSAGPLHPIPSVVKRLRTEAKTFEDIVTERFQHCWVTQAQRVMYIDYGEFDGAKYIIDGTQTVGIRIANIGEVPQLFTTLKGKTVDLADMCPIHCELANGGKLAIRLSYAGPGLSRLTQAQRDNIAKTIADSELHTTDVTLAVTGPADLVAAFLASDRKAFGKAAEAYAKSHGETVEKLR